MNKGLSGIDSVGFDLFETLLRVDWKRLPVIRIDGRMRPSTAPYLIDAVQTLLPSMTVEHLAVELMANWMRVRALCDSDQAEQHLEITSERRFAYLLEALGLPEDNEVATDLANLHHAAVRESVYVPEDERSLLMWCAKRMPVGLITNFDHAQSCRKILSDHALDLHFSTILISAEAGIRKPHAQLFESMLQELDRPAEGCVFIGDDPRADVDGALAAGLEAIWLCRDARLPDPSRAPSAIVTQALEVQRLLEKELG